MRSSYSRAYSLLFTYTHGRKRKSLARRRYIPFSGGPRKCVGDQFALMEAVVSLAVVLKRFSFKAVPGHKVGMTTGATIHTQNGLFMTVTERKASGGRQADAGQLEPVAA